MFIYGSEEGRRAGREGREGIPWRREKGEGKAGNGKSANVVLGISVHDFPRLYILKFYISCHTEAILVFFVMCVTR